MLAVESGGPGFGFNRGFGTQANQRAVPTQFAPKRLPVDYEEFLVHSPLEGEAYQCRFHTLVTGISLRHSDTVDVKFLVNGTGVVLALPHAAFAEYRRKTGRALTDRDAIQIAGLALKELLERGERVDTPLLTLSGEQTLELAEQIHSAAFQ